MSVVFAAAELTSPNHFYFPGNTMPGRLDVANPEEFLVPKTVAPAPMPQWAADRRLFVLPDEFHDCIGYRGPTHGFWRDC